MNKGEQYYIIQDLSAHQDLEYVLVETWIAENAIWVEIYIEILIWHA